jgi:hypothetical protein
MTRWRRSTKRRAEVVLTVGLVVAGCAVAAIGAPSQRPAMVASAATSAPPWVQVTPVVSPPAQYLAAMSNDGSGQVLLFAVDGSTWRWDGSAWTQLHPVHAPSARYGAAMAYDTASAAIVLFGGRDQSTGAVLGDTWAWDGTDWQELSPVWAPPARYLHAMAYDAATQRVVLFGGTTASTSLGDTWEWDGASWAQLGPDGASPSPRYHAAMAYDALHADLVLFGGLPDDTGAPLGDTWTLNGSAWDSHAPLASPPPTDGASLTFDAAEGDSLLVGGEQAPEGPYVWAWDGTTWSPRTSAVEPPERKYQSAAYDDATNSVVVFGGLSVPCCSPLADTWSSAGPTGLLRVTTSPSVPTQVLIDGQVADSWGLNWVQLPAGTHTVSFTHVEGYTEPPPQTVTVTAGTTTTVVGTFTQRGELRVVTSPPVPSAIAVDGNPSDEWGVWTDLASGSHQVCFGPVVGYDPPPCQTVAVTPGQTTTVTGSFTVDPAAAGQTGVGTLRVTTVPALPAQITITPQGGTPYIADSWGLNWLELSPGTYTVSVSHVEGYTEPSPQSVTVTAGSASTLTEDFQARGELRVTTSPPAPGLVSIDGVPADNWGVWTDEAAGPHFVCFGAVAGAITPPCQAANVTAGSETDVDANYRLPGSAN